METYNITQMLAVTCNNASSNNVMIDEMEHLIVSFRGCCARSRCFCHIINLVAKMVLHQFEPPKHKKKTGTHDDEDDDEGDLTDWDKELQRMMEDLDFNDEDEDAPGADSLEGFYDIRDDMSTAERATMEAEVRLVKTMLLKVSAL